MSKMHHVFKPLFIDTFEYFYMDGKTEKSFTIKKKSDPKPVKPKMQQSEPLASFNNETIQQNHKRAQTSRRMKSSSFVKNSTINSNTPIHKDIRKVESRNEEEIVIQPTITHPQRRNFRIPQFNYLNKKHSQQIAVMNGEASNSFNKALELIKKDKRLMKKKRSTKTPSTQSNDVTQLEYMENSHHQDVMEQLGKMLSISEKHTPMQKQSKTRETFTRNLKFLDQSFQEVTSPDKKLKSVIQNYFDKKQAYLEEQTKKQEITITQLSEQTKPNRGSNRMRISTSFLKQFVDSAEDAQQKSIQKQNSTSQSIKSSQIFQQKNKKKATAIFSGQVRNIFQKMFHLIVGCVRKMKQMKLTTVELFKSGVFYKKPYEREGSFQFFEGIEENNIKIVNFMLLRCRYYAFDINEEGLTPLHISSQRGFRQITERLLQSGAFPDSPDNSGKTPLFYAIKSNQYSIVLLLLYYKANPWSEKKCQLITQNEEIMKLLKKSRRLHILQLMTRHCDREEVWINSRDMLLN